MDILKEAEIRAAIGRAVTSFCDVLGHCKEHRPCCYCLEADRVRAEALKMFRDTENA